MDISKLDDFTRAYMECALWTTFDEDGGSLEDFHSITDIDDETATQMVADCAKFQSDNTNLLEQAYPNYVVPDESSPEAYAGHDFWLTRNHHGAGFWDRDLGEVGEQLTEAAQTYKEVDLYVGDDGKIYV